MLAKFALLSALALTVTAQAPTERELDIVDAQWENSGFESNSLTGFGLDLDAEARLDVDYGFGRVVNGNPYTAEQVAALPTLTITPRDANDDDFAADQRYTVMLADAAALGDPDREGNFRHYLLVNATGTVNNGSITPTGGNLVTSYAGPGPLPGSGTHRYSWMVFTQGDDARFPLAEGAGAGHWNVSQYVDQADLDLVAASFFTVDASGTPTGAVVSTSAVNTATFTSRGNVASSAASGASSVTSRAAGAVSSGVSAASSAAAAATSRPASSASKIGASFVGAVAGVVGLVALA